MDLKINSTRLFHFSYLNRQTFVAKSCQLVGVKIELFWDWLAVWALKQLYLAVKNLQLTRGMGLQEFELLSALFGHLKA